MSSTGYGPLLRSSARTTPPTTPTIWTDENGHPVEMGTMVRHELVIGKEPQEQNPTVLTNDDLSALFGRNIEPAQCAVYIVVTRWTSLHEERPFTYFVQSNAVFIGRGLFLSSSHAFRHLKKMTGDHRDWRMEIFAHHSIHQVDVKRLGAGLLPKTVHLAVASHMIGRTVAPDGQLPSSQYLDAKEDLCVLKAIKNAPDDHWAALPPLSDHRLSFPVLVDLIVYNGDRQVKEKTVNAYGGMLSYQEIKRRQLALYPRQCSTSTGVVEEGDATPNNPIISPSGPLLLHTMSTVEGASGGGLFHHGTSQLVGIHVGSTSPDGGSVTARDRNVAVNLVNPERELQAFLSREVLSQMADDADFAKTWSFYLNGPDKGDEQ